MSGHTSRVLHLAQSPDGTTVCSAAADETLRFWKCFAEAAPATKVASLFSLPPSLLAQPAAWLLVPDRQQPWRACLAYIAAQL